MQKTYTVAIICAYMCYYCVLLLGIAKSSPNRHASFAAPHWNPRPREALEPWTPGINFGSKGCGSLRRIGT